MSKPKALLVIDVQKSFLHRPYFREQDVAAGLPNIQKLIERAERAGDKIVQIFHIEDTGPFASDSGLVAAMEGVKLSPDHIVSKRRYSAFVGTDLENWLRAQGIDHIQICGIRTEQCCETTARHGRDLGFTVDFMMDATITFPISDAQGRLWTSEEIKTRVGVVLDGRFASMVNVEEAYAL